MCVRVPVCSACVCLLWVIVMLFFACGGVRCVLVLWMLLNRHFDVAMFDAQRLCDACRRVVGCYLVMCAMLRCIVVCHVLIFYVSML